MTGIWGFHPRIGSGMETIPCFFFVLDILHGKRELVVPYMMWKETYVIGRQKLCLLFEASCIDSTAGRYNPSKVILQSLNWT